MNFTSTSKTSLVTLIRLKSPVRLQRLIGSLILIMLPNIARPALAQPIVDQQDRLADLQQQFHAYSGAKLVFAREELPEGQYHDVLTPLRVQQKIAAAEICIEQARVYPPGFLGAVGLKVIGVFAACVSKTTNDLNRPYDRDLGGYRYFGVYNGSTAIAAAMYSEGQLELTFHHEIFHHVDSTVDGITEAWQLSSDDAAYNAAVSGLKPYRGLSIEIRDIALIRSRCTGLTLHNAVSKYAEKNPREDQAETARHIMSTLPDAILQAIERPELPGSQRIIHTQSRTITARDSTGSSNHVVVAAVENQSGRYGNIVRHLWARGFDWGESRVAPRSVAVRQRRQEASRDCDNVPCRRGNKHEMGDTDSVKSFASDCPLLRVHRIQMVGDTGYQRCF